MIARALRWFSSQIAKEVAGLVGDSPCRSNTSELAVIRQHQARAPVMLGDRLFMHTSDGHRLLLDPRDLQLAACLIERGVYEEHIREVLARFLKPGGTYVDVGANIGLHVLYASCLVQQKGLCHAFEPGPTAFNFLDANIDVNGLRSYVALHNLAVSDSNGKTSFCVHDSHPMQSGIGIPDEILAITGTPRSALRRIEISKVALDDYLGQIHVDVLKVDVEGFEPAVIRGARKIIQRNPDIVLIVERNGMSELVLNDKTEDAKMIAFFKSEGFIPYAAIWLQPIRRCDYHELPNSDIVFTRNPNAF